MKTLYCTYCGKQLKLIHENRRISHGYDMYTGKEIVVYVDVYACPEYNVWVMSEFSAPHTYKELVHNENS